MSTLTTLTDRAGQRQVWGSLAAAVGTQIKDEQWVRGASGLDHYVQALAVDEARSRLLPRFVGR